MRQARAQRRLSTYIVGLSAAAAIVTAVGLVLEVAPASPVRLFYLPFLVLALLCSEVFRVRFRRGRHTTALTLFESVLAPLIFGFSLPLVLVSVGVVQIAVAIYRRHAPIKGAFNLAQWLLTAAIGVLIADTLRGDGRGVTVASLTALVVAVAVIVIVNHLAVVVVVAITEQESLGHVLSGLRAMADSIGLGFVVNALFGLLFVFAIAGSGIAVLLIPVPLVLMYLAYRGYAQAQADGHRLEGLRDAANALSAPLSPLHAIEPYLDEVRKSFDARAAVLVLTADETIIFRNALDAGGRVSSVRERQPAMTGIETRLASLENASRIRGTDHTELGRTLDADGWTECLSAPLVEDSGRLGTLIVFDQAGFEGTESSELAVLEALARETAHTLARGRLLDEVIQQERRLDQIIGSTSDGIFTLAEDGRLLTWNTACTVITGYDATTMLGRRDLMRSLEGRNATGRPVDLSSWITMASVPREILITTAKGDHRRLSCSATAAVDPDGTRSLVVVARDITPADEYEELKEQFGHLVEAQAAQRLVVDHLQQAVAPEPPGIEGADIAVAYVASDPSSPTGGDLFDWHELPSGELHVAVVDVLGHGVTATKDALTVVHTLRFAAVDGTPLEEIVTRADQLLSAQDTDLVATVVVARYDPETGLLRIASGGHPPALIVGPGGEVTQVSATGGAIGWPAVGSDLVATVQLDINDSVVFYTDGLIESRKDIIEGLDELSRNAADVAHLPAQQFADELVRRTLLGADRRDDTLALVLRRTRQMAHTDHLRWRIDPREPESLRLVRRELQAWLSGRKVQQDDAVLVAAELLANGSSVARSSLVLNATLGTGTLVLEVEDDGPGAPDLHSVGRQLPDGEAERGRGMYLVRALSEDVDVLSTAEGTVVRATVAVRGTSSASRRFHEDRAR